MKLQAGARGFLARAEARRLRRLAAATKIQAAVRRYQARSQYLRTRKAVLRIQAAYRGHTARAVAFDLRYCTLPSLVLHEAFSQLNCSCFQLCISTSGEAFLEIVKVFPTVFGFIRVLCLICIGNTRQLSGCKQLGEDMWRARASWLIAEESLLPRCASSGIHIILPGFSQLAWCAICSCAALV